MNYDRTLRSLCQRNSAQCSWQVSGIAVLEGVYEVHDKEKRWVNKVAVYGLSRIEDYNVTARAK